MSPSEAFSSSTDFPVVPVIRLACSADFATGRGGLLQLLSASLPSCCRFHPARVAHRFGQLAMIHAAFALQRKTRPLGLLITGPLLRSLSLRPDDLLTILKMALSIGIRNSISLLSAIQATRPLTITLVVYLPLSTLAFPGHATGQADFPHPALGKDTPCSV